jgi:hypothetical protein
MRWTWLEARLQDIIVCLVHCFKAVTLPYLLLMRRQDGFLTRGYKGKYGQHDMTNRQIIPI